MNNHPSEESISALVDGMLQVGDTKRVLAHLRDCAACRDTFETFTYNKALVRSSPPPETPSPEFWAQTYRRMRTEVAVPSVPKQRLVGGGIFARANHRRWGPALAAIMAVGAAIIVPLSQSNVSPPSASINTEVAAGSGADVLEISNLVRAHTNSVARQPLSDPDRQHMISLQADQASLTDNPYPEAAFNADSAL